MKLMLVAGLAGLAVGAVALRPADIWDIYRQLYPSDPAARRALNECFTRDARFNRFDAAARDACYRHNLPAVLAAAGGEQFVQPRASANFVDLWRAAGQGRMPANDVRAEQQNERFLHPAAGSATR